MTIEESSLNTYLNRQSETFNTPSPLEKISQIFSSFLELFEPIIIFLKNLRYDCFGPSDDRPTLCARTNRTRSDSYPDIFGGHSLKISRQSTRVTTQK